MSDSGKFAIWPGVVLMAIGGLATKGGMGNHLLSEALEGDDGAVLLCLGG